MADTQVSAIGKYRIIEPIGKGAMGVVYKAVDTVLDRTVAIKVMNDSIAQDEGSRKRFLREARSAGSLQHPNIVTIHDLGEIDGHLFIAMEFIDGVDLEHLIEVSEPLSLQARLDVIIDVLKGLAYAHKRGIVHRDIKPANIRVGEDGRTKVMDFGVAHLVSSTMTSSGVILGTPSYMAPEQITEGTTSAATDIFAVGGVLYQILTMVRPFDGPTLPNLLFRIVTEHPRPVSHVMPGLPIALDHIVQKAMAKEPAQRYASATEMANDLTSVRAVVGGSSHPAALSLSASVASALEQSRKTSGIRTRKAAYIVGAALAAASVIAIAWSQFARPGSTEPDSGKQALIVSSALPQVVPTTTRSPTITPSPAPKTRAPVTPPSQELLAPPPAAIVKTKTPAIEPPPSRPIRSPSVCGGSPRCAEVSSFVAIVTDFRESRGSQGRIVGLTIRFRNITNGPLILGYLIGSGVVTDDRGNRYTIDGDGVRGLGQVRPGAMIDPKFVLRSGESADARFEFSWGSGGALFGTRFVVELAVREIQSVGREQWRLGQEHVLHFRGFDSEVASAQE